MREENDTLTLGEPICWARDLALVGGFTTLALGLVTPLRWDTVGVAAALVALTGAALGSVFPRLLHRQVRSKPILLLLAAGVGLGACWGAIAGLTAALLTAAPWVHAASLVGTATALQLGWLWLPLLLGHTCRKRVVEWVMLALLASPAVGWLAYQHVTW